MMGFKAHYNTVILT